MRCLPAKTEAKKSIKRELVTLSNFSICTLFLFSAIKLSIYIPTLLNTSTQYLPGYKGTLSNSDYVNESFSVVFGTIGFGNPVFLFSSILMALNGLYLFAFTDYGDDKSIWKKTVIATFSIGGVLVTIFSVRGI